ncbi:MAG: phage major capsid protein [Oscillibacter sp.]|nr:phage major capsid protein [Oscillibacter sp.]
MPTTTTNALALPHELVTDIFSKVKGHSSLAALCGQKPIPFRGVDVMVFSMDGEAELVGEGENKSPNSAAFTPVSITPIKFVYQHRVTDEFVKMNEEARLPYLEAFGDGFAAKIARALDIAAFHGMDPKSATVASSISAKSFDTMVTGTVTYDATAADDNLQDAVAAIQANDGIVTGIAMAPAFGAALADVKVNGVRQFPEFLFGANPGSFYGMNVDINGTVAFGNSTDRAIVGDFQNAFRWGYSDNLGLEIIEYGDPDGLGDLKRKNQVVLRSEAYIGWGILDAAAFQRIVTA